MLAVLGLTLALALPNLSRALPGLELRTDTRDVAGALREARAIAIGRNQEVTLTIDVEKRALRIGGEPLIRLNPQIGISLVTAASEIAGAGAGAIRFFPDGTSTGGRVTLARGERQQHVVVDWLTGAVSVVE